MAKNLAPWQVGRSDAPLPPCITVDTVDNRLAFYLQQYRDCGPVFRVEENGKVRTVLAGPDANMFMAQMGGETLSYQEFWEDLDAEYFGQGMPRAGQANRLRRALQSRGFSRSKITGRIDDVVEITRQFAGDWRPGDVVAFCPWIQRTVAEQLGQVLTQQGPGEYFPDLVLFLRELLAATMTRKESRSRLQREDYRRAKDRVFELGRSIVAAHRASPPEGHRPDLVDDVIAVAAQYGYEPSGEQLVGAALAPFLAGLDTVSIATSYALYALLTHIEALRRVTGEVDAVWAGGAPTWKELQNLHGLHGAIIEALRLYPINIEHGCQATQPFTFAGCRVERGDDVQIATALPHFLPDLFPEPERFDIDRHSPPRNEHRTRGAFAPFGVGDRTCLGSGIAEVQIMVTLATLLRHFDLELGPGTADHPPLEQTPVSMPADLRVQVTAIRDRPGR